MKKSLHSYKTYVSHLGQVLESINEDEIVQFVTLIETAAKKKQTIFIIGNGGSASTASHWSNDISKGLFHRTGKMIRSLSLTDNVSWMTAVANDIGYDAVFSDQLKTFAKKGDLLVSISASGNSPNILHAIKTAKKMGVQTLAIVGFDGGKAKKDSDYAVHIPTPKGQYGTVEDAQLILNHFLCDYIAGLQL
jgi:D-sedoheptulose 7-phosphate isomerase